MNYTSLVITRTGTKTWVFRDNTMPITVQPNGASGYTAVISQDNTITFDTQNGGVVYNHIPATIISYTDTITPANSFPASASRTAASLLNFLKGQGFFDGSSSGEGGATTFTGLSDTPPSYTGNANRVVRVNPGANGLIFDDVPGLSQDNIDIFRIISTVVEPGTLNIANYLNSGSPFSVSEIQSLWVEVIYRGSLINNGDIINVSPTVSYRYKMINKGKGNYGLNGTPLSNSDFKLLYVTPATTSDIENDPATDIINYGSLTTQNVSQWLNARNPQQFIKQQDLGYTLFKGTVNGTETDYLFVGDSGSYGVGSSQSTMSDFQVLSDTVPPSENITAEEPLFIDPSTNVISLQPNPFTSVRLFQKGVILGVPNTSKEIEVNDICIGFTITGEFGFWQYTGGDNDQDLSNYIPAITVLLNVT